MIIITVEQQFPVYVSHAGRFVNIYVIHTHFFSFLSGSKWSTGRTYVLKSHVPHVVAGCTCSFITRTHINWRYKDSDTHAGDSRQKIFHHHKCMSISANCQFAVLNSVLVYVCFEMNQLLIILYPKYIRYWLFLSSCVIGVKMIKYRLVY